MSVCRILVAPAYYAFVIGKNRAALKDFYVSVANESPVPVLLYNVRFAYSTALDWRNTDLQAS